MTRARTAGLFFAVALWVCQSIAPAICRAALAVSTGGSGTSGKLSSNANIRKQQLLCDPLNPSVGSYSLSYDPSLVSYDQGSLISVPGYTITSAYISRDFGTITSPSPFLVDINSTGFSGDPETGYIQVFFQQDTTTTYKPPGITAGYTLVDAAGVNGNETHGLTFSYLPAVADTTFASYTIFADPGGRQLLAEAVSPADSLTDDAGNVIPYNEIAPSTVTGNLFVPEPASLGVLAVAALALFRRRRAP